MSVRPPVSLFACVSVVALSAAVVPVVHAHEATTETVEVIVTGSGYGVDKNALMSKVDVLSRNDIQTRPAAGLGDLLADTVGVRSSSFAPGASRPVIRGLDGYRVLILNNGLGQVDASAVSPDHAVSTDPMEARRIEVLRGASALTYGGNAIGGIVNVIDDRIATAPVQGIEGSASAQASSVDDGTQLGFNVRAGVGNWVFSADAVRRRSSDYATPVGPESRWLTDEEGEERDTRTRQDNSFAELDAYGAGLSYVGAFGFAGLSVKQTDSRYGVPGHVHAHHEEDDHDHDHDHDHEDHGPVTIGLKQTRYDFRSEILIPGPFNRLQLGAGYADYEHTEYEGDEIGTVFSSQGSEVRAALVRSDQGPLSATVGFNALTREFAAVGEEAFVPSSTTDEAGLFAQARYDFGGWGYEGGLRIDRKSITAAGFDRDFDGLSASVGAFWKPSDHAFAGVAFSRSERAPSDVELLADGPHAGTGAYEIGNAAFDTEVGYSLEITGHWLMDEHSAFSVDAHIYASRFDGFIDLRPTGEEEDGLPVYQYQQTDADFYGFELEAGVNLPAPGWRLNGSWDYVHGQSDLGPIARIPPHAVTLSISYAMNGWSNRFEVRKVGEQDRLAELESPTPGYTTVNLYVSRQLANGVVLFAEGRNLTDAEIREHASVAKNLVVGAGRNIRAGVAYRF